MNFADQDEEKHRQHSDEIDGGSITKKEKLEAVQYKGDENKIRGNWSGKLDFLLSCLGYAVGLGNVWRFPYLCYKNGGGAFFIPYFIFLIFVGMPIFLLELSMGQFTSQGLLTCWENSKLFTGIGWAMLIVSCMITLYYNVIIAWAIWYLCASFTSKLPWTDCNGTDQYKPTNLCWTKYMEISEDSCISYYKGNLTKMGSCVVNGSLYAITNSTIAREYGLTKRTVAEDYLNEVGFQLKDSDGFSNLGPLRWDMSLALLLAWIIICICLSKGIKSSGKVVYFTAIFPYVILIILFVRGFFIDGYEEGINYYIKPDLTKLSDSVVWKDAAVQTFFTLSTTFGGLIVLASYNKFHNNLIRDTFIVCVCNCLTSIFAGFVVFSYLGALSKKLNVTIENVAQSGVSLAFIIYPQAVTYLPYPPLWSALFFLMLITLGVDSQFADVEAVLGTVIDKLYATKKIKAITWKVKLITAIVVCVIGFFGSLIMATAGGPYMLTLMDDYVGGWNVMLIALFECICIAWVYKAKRFCNDINVMMRNQFHGSWTCCRWYWIINWSAITPILVTFTMIFSLVQYQGSQYGSVIFPVWANVLGWLMTLVVVVALFIPGIYYMITTKGTFRERLRILTTPTQYWGPALMQNRKEVKESHSPEMPIDPSMPTYKGIAMSGNTNAAYMMDID